MKLAENIIKGFNSLNESIEYDGIYRGKQQLVPLTDSDYQFLGGASDQAMKSKEFEIKGLGECMIVWDGYRVEIVYVSDDGDSGSLFRVFKNDNNAYNAALQMADLGSSMTTQFIKIKGFRNP